MLRKDPNRSPQGADSRSSSSATSSSAPHSAHNGRASKSDRRRGAPGKGPGPRHRAIDHFVLYVEGARDREILESWARRLDPSLARLVEANTVILGGRQPTRALEDFAKRRNRSAELRGLIVLDRDHHTAEETLEVEAVVAGEPDLELFVWGHRHIESYLLVPATLRRVLGIDPGDDRIERALARSTRDAATSNKSLLHAKRLLGAGGSLSEALGVELRSGEIAKAMRSEELHADVHLLFDRIGRLSGVISDGPEIVIRAPRA